VDEGGGYRSRRTDATLTPDDTPTYTHPLDHTRRLRLYMGGSDKRKQSLYFPEEMLKEIQDEATRQDRSLSWIVQKAWKISRKEIMKYPSVNEFPGEEDERGATE
jgi:uncharacterized small protein (TIGR04563 family)